MTNRLSIVPLPYLMHNAEGDEHTVALLRSEDFAGDPASVVTRLHWTGVGDADLLLWESEQGPFFLLENIPHEDGRRLERTNRLGIGVLSVTENNEGRVEALNWVDRSPDTPPLAGPLLAQQQNQGGL